MDLAILLTEGACKFLAENHGFKILQLYIKSPLVWGVHTGKHSKIKNYEEAYSSKIAISRFGSGSHLMPQVDAHFKKKNINEKQFEIIKNLDGALKSFKENPSQIFYWEKFTTKPYVDNGQLKRIGEFITPWPCFVIVAREDVLTEYKKEVKSILEVINYASKQFMNSSNARETLVDQFTMLPEDAHQWFFMTEWDTEINAPAKTLENVMQILKDCGVMEETMESKDLVFQL